MTTGEPKCRHCGSDLRSGVPCATCEQARANHDAQAKMTVVYREVENYGERKFLWNEDSDTLHNENDRNEIRRLRAELKKCHAMVDALDHDLSALQVERDKLLERAESAERAKYGTPCKCESWIETCGAAEAARDVLEIQLKEVREELKQAKESYDRACQTIAKMHEAAMGEVRGPNRGVVEDVQDLKSALDEALFKKVQMESDAFVWGMAKRMKELIEEGKAARVVGFLDELIENDFPVEKPLDKLLAEAEGALGHLSVCGRMINCDGCMRAQVVREDLISKGFISDITASGLPWHPKYKKKP